MFNKNIFGMAEYGVAVPRRPARQISVRLPYFCFGSIQPVGMTGMVRPTTGVSLLPAPGNAAIAIFMQHTPTLEFIAAAIRPPMVFNVTDDGQLHRSGRTFKMEQRRYERTLLAAPIQVTHPAFGSVLVESRDLSPDGAYIRPGRGFPLPALGTVYEIQIHGHMDGSSRTVPAEVVHAEADGFGLRFLSDPFQRETPG